MPVDLADLVDLTKNMNAFIKKKLQNQNVCWHNGSCLVELENVS